MTLYKEIIHIFAFKVFESTRSGTDIEAIFTISNIKEKYLF